MATLLVTFIVLALIIAMMSVGVLMGRKPVQGSCGGLNKIEGMGDCEICGGDRDRCDESGSQ
ncbi:MAG: hypothetical protein PsegKO_04580 [Pseudohongiellaceae bacterium]|jgi:hypothetical protein